MKRLLLLLLLLPFALVLLAPVATAAAPDARGWWTSFPGASPDVPADGLLIEGGASTASPSAFGAVVYSVPDGGAVGKLTLAVVPSSASVPMTKLELCPLASTVFDPAQGGAMADAPKFDCHTNVTAQTSSNGSYEFDVSSLVNGGALAVAILPTSPTDRVVLAAPGATSLAIEPPAGSGSHGVTDTAGSGAPGYTVPQASPALSPPATAAIAAPKEPIRQARSAPVEYVPTLAASVTHARGAAVLLVIAGALVIGGGWFAIGRVSVQRALAEGNTE